MMFKTLTQLSYRSVDYFLRDLSFGVQLQDLPLPDPKGSKPPLWIATQDGHRWILFGNQNKGLFALR